MANCEQLSAYLLANLLSFYCFESQIGESVQDYVGLESNIIYSGSVKRMHVSVKTKSTSVISDSFCNHLGSSNSKT